MIELPPDVEERLREKAASSGQDVGNYLRLILDQPLNLNGEAGRLSPDDYPREGEDWTEEDLQVDLEWAMRQRPPA